MIRLIQRRKGCIGCGYCAEIAPDFWEMDFNDGKCNLIGAENRKGIFELEIFDEDIELNRKAAESCPVSIIRLI
ncbi:MAG: ferredoxin [Marinifilaceae bacterium]